MSIEKMYYLACNIFCMFVSEIFWYCYRIKMLFQIFFHGVATILRVFLFIEGSVYFPANV